MLVVVELLENVLVGLDFKTLLLAQRVSTLWRNTVAGSQKLQKKLFFRRATIIEVFELGMIDDDTLVNTCEEGVCGVLHEAIFRPAPDKASCYDRIQGALDLPLIPHPAAIARGSNTSCYHMLIGHGEPFKIEFNMRGVKYRKNKRAFATTAIKTHEFHRYERLQNVIDKGERALWDLFPNSKVSWPRSHLMMDPYQIVLTDCMVIRYGDFKKQWESGKWAWHWSGEGDFSDDEEPSDP